MATLNYFLAPMNMVGTKASEEFANKIIDTVLTYTGRTEEEIAAKTRKGEVAYVRHLLFYFLANFSTMSLKSIGQRFGGRDHTTVIHGREKIRDLKSVYPDVQADCEKVFQMILEGD